MNILVISSELLANATDFRSADFAATVHEVYLSERFHAILVLSFGDMQGAEFFDFAKTFKKDVIKSDDIKVMASNIVDALDRLTAEFEKTCDFTLLCDKDNLLEQIVQMSKNRRCLCFMQVREDEELSNFTDIPLLSDDTGAGCSLFMSNVVHYEAERKYDNLFRKINKLKRVNIHCVWKPSANPFPDQVRI